MFILAVVLFWPASIGGKVLSAGDIPLFSAPFPSQGAAIGPKNGLQFDAANVFEPDGLLVRGALRDARLPVWASQLSNGRPLLAAQQSAPLFPLTWIGVVFPFFSALVWIAVLKIAIAGFGTFLLARALGLRRAPAFVGAIAFGFGTYLVVWLMHPHSNAYVLLPWLFLMAERLCRGGRVRDAAALGGLLGLSYLGGQPESGLIVSLATASWTVYQLWVADILRRDLARRIALAAAAVLLGVAIAAVMLAPLVEALHQSYNTSRAAPPLSLKTALSLFFPDFWGRPDQPGPVFGPSNYTERTVYLGVLPTLLAAAGLFARRPRGPQLFFAALVLAAFAVALHNPVATVARHVPVLDQVNLTRLVILASFGIAMLAAFGCERFLNGTTDERRRMLLAAALTALLPVLATVALHPDWLADSKQAVNQLLGRISSPRRM